MINPGVGVAWGLLSPFTVARRRDWSRFAVALLVAGLTLAPWTVRNYQVFGRFTPVKSNLYYEMYQTHCLQVDGLLESRTFRFHPYNSEHSERQEYERLGEAGFTDRKREQLFQAIEADPWGFVDRVYERMLGATLRYVPFRRDEAAQRPWAFWLNRLTHPIPFLALVFLLVSGNWQPLHRTQGIVIGIYFLYLLPYVVASYYERYSMPLLGVKVFLILCAVDRVLNWRRAT
jgi:hypothetical protein